MTDWLFFVIVDSMTIDIILRKKFIIMNYFIIEYEGLIK